MLDHAPDSIPESSLPVEHYPQDGPMFGILQQQKPSPKRPDHTAQLTKSLGVCVWTRHDTNTDQVTMHWKVERVDGKDSSKMYSTLSVASILEFPRFLSKLSLGMAKIGPVSPRLKSELLSLAKEMEEVANRREANGHASEEKTGLEAIQF